ncbi:hypothetical protein MASR2M47_41370 [Draconibacterium sp.]
MNQHDFKNQYPDLILPLMQCSEGIPIVTCPFIPYWYTNGISKRIELMSNLSPEQLDDIRIFHVNCLKNKLEELENRKTLANSQNHTEPKE